MVDEEKVKFTVFAEDSDFHGVRQVTRRENGLVRRIIWGLLLTVSLGVLINNTTMQIIYYFEYNHITKYDITFVHQLDYPAVTICNVNKHKRSEMTLWDIYEMGPHLEMTYPNRSLIHPELYPEDWYNDMFVGRDWQQVADDNEGKVYDLEDFYNRTAHRFEDLVQACRWKSVSCEESSWEVDYTHYSKCYTFNSLGDHQLLKAGSGNGLEMVLYDEEDDYIESKDSEDLGFKFLAHSPIEPPFLKELGFGLAPGFHYLIALQQREIFGLGGRYTECEKDHATKYFPNYTVPGCRIECETEIIYQNCSCKLVESPGNYSVCTTEQYDCTVEVLKKIEESDLCVCQNPCHATQYPFTMSILELRQTTIDKLAKTHPIPENLTTKELAVVNIYFDSLAYEEITQVPAYTVLDILSDFGGTMGLWLGASVLAAIQLLDYLAMFCSVRCCKRGRVHELTPTRQEK
ncbi:acid-sensing ion channel 1C-like [Watersipora subatra]|uniref:acid-sensing ion channel 1C-like n=1 Tax=Watersipora subatra TaxID=2589382 RepID=UPI00355BEB20